MEGEECMYKKVLIPLDGSEADETILDHMMGLAKIHGSELHLIRVIHSHTRDALRHETEVATTYLEASVARFKESGIPAEWIIEYGEPENVIPEKAKEISADLIAMATHGHGWLIDILFGSVAHKVRHTVSIPVLMIRRN